MDTLIKLTIDKYTLIHIQHKSNGMFLLLNLIIILDL
jgi:hypothetical protein